MTTMKLYNLLLWLLICTLAPYKLVCQTYIGMDIGYGLPLAAQNMSEGNLTFYDNDTYENSVFRFSLGAGTTYSLALSHEINRKMAISCGVSYLQGNSHRKIIISDALLSKYVDTYSGNMFWFTPQIRLKSPKIKQLSPYFEIGPSFGCFGKVVKRIEYNSPMESSKSKSINNKGISYGASATLGGTFRPFKKNDKWHVNIAIRMVSASFAPKQSELVQLEQNGVDILSTRSVSGRKRVYKKKYISDPSAPGNPNLPNTSLRRYYPFSSIALNIGLCYRLK